MKVCFPITQDEGLNSKLFNHFNSAPLFLIVDSETRETTVVANCDPRNEQQGCNPYAALHLQQLDAIIVDAIGDAALQTMNNLCGFRVYETRGGTLEETLEQLAANSLIELAPCYSHEAGRCGDDGDEGSCDHDHDHDHEEEEADCSSCALQGTEGCGSQGKTSCDTVH